MDIFAYALQMELDGEAYYTELAKHAGYKDLEVVFMDLAEAEKRHYEVIILLRQVLYLRFPMSLLFQMNSKKNRRIGWLNGKRNSLISIRRLF